MTFRALNSRVLWGTTPLDLEASRDLLSIFLRHGAQAPYWQLHDAMTEAGMIPARPSLPNPDLTFNAGKAEPWTVADEGIRQ